MYSVLAEAAMKNLQFAECSEVLAHVLLVSAQFSNIPLFGLGFEEEHAVIL